jgi:hypothetical protein
MCFATEDNVKHLFTNYVKVKEIREYIHDERQNQLQASRRYKRGDISMLIDLNERHTLEEIIIGDILCNDGKDLQKYSRTTQITFLFGERNRI